MPRLLRFIGALATVTALTAVPARAVEPLFTLGDGGRTFLYRARPGDLPSTVAEQFGISSRDLPAFLTANGITDPTRVGAGFVYRVPNAAVLALESRNATLEAENARLTREASDTSARTTALTREMREAQSAATAATERADRAARLESLWPFAQAVCVVLALIAAASVGVTVAALRRHRQAARYARTLATELDDKRRTALAERQESARRVLDLEARVRALESQLGPRVVIGGRTSS